LPTLHFTPVNKVLQGFPSFFTIFFSFYIKNENKVLQGIGAGISKKGGRDKGKKN
jgi:hypothetical protein